MTKRILASLLALTMTFSTGALLAGAEESENSELWTFSEKSELAKNSGDMYFGTTNDDLEEIYVLLNKLKTLSLNDAKTYLKNNGYYFEIGESSDGHTDIDLYHFGGLVGKKSGDFLYVELENGVQVSGYSGTSSDIVIPSTIEGKKVTSIAALYSECTVVYDSATGAFCSGAVGGASGFPICNSNLRYNIRSVYIPASMTNFSFNGYADDLDFLSTLTWEMRNEKNDLIFKCEKGSAADKWLQESISAKPDVYSNIKIEYVTDVSVSTPVFKSFSCTTNAVRINWNKVSGASGYRVYRYNTATKKWETVKTISGGSTVTYRDSGLKAGTNYKYKVKAYVKENGKTYWSEASNTITTATKPTTVKITKAGKTTTAVRLYWNKVNCTGYKLQQYNPSTKKWTTVKLLKSTDTNYRISGLKKNTAYKFRIQAYKTAGSQKAYGAWSATKTVTTKK